MRRVNKLQTLAFLILFLTASCKSVFKVSILRLVVSWDFDRVARTPFTVSWLLSRFKSFWFIPRTLCEGLKPCITVRPNVQRGIPLHHYSPQTTYAVTLCALLSQSLLATSWIFSPDEDKAPLPPKKQGHRTHYTYSSPPLPPTPVKRPPFSKCSPFWPFSVFSVTAYGVNRGKYRRLPRYACIPQKAKMGGELNWACMRLGQSCIELHYGTVLGHSRFFCWLLETFRFWDENEYDYDIFSILSIAHAWTQWTVIGAGKRDSRRHSTSSISENVVEVGRNYQM